MTGKNRETLIPISQNIDKKILTVIKWSKIFNFVHKKPKKGLPTLLTTCAYSFFFSFFFNQNTKPQIVFPEQKLPCSWPPGH